MQMITAASTAGIMIMMGSRPGGSVGFMESSSIDVVTVEGKQRINHSFHPGLITVLKFVHWHKNMQRGDFHGALLTLHSIQPSDYYSCTGDDYCSRLITNHYSCGKRSSQLYIPLLEPLPSALTPSGNHQKLWDGFIQNEKGAKIEQIMIKNKAKHQLEV